jgi:hypothetical protein
MTKIALQSGADAVSDIFEQLSKSVVSLLADSRPVTYIRAGERKVVSGILRTRSEVQPIPATGEAIRLDELMVIIHEPDLGEWTVSTQDRIIARNTLYDISTFHRKKNGLIEIVLLEASEEDGQREQGEVSENKPDFSLKIWSSGPTEEQ